MLTRYEWEIKGQRVGFFQGLDDLKPIEYDSIDRSLDYNLPCPPKWVYKKYPQAKSYFTQIGIRKFESDIQSIIDLIVGCGIGGAIERITNIKENEVHKTVYEDKYQKIIILKKGDN